MKIKHEWQVSRFAGTKTCSRCDLLPLDAEDEATSCLHYHTGMNIPGYGSMDDEPLITTDWESARDDVRAMLDPDSLTDDWDGPDKDAWEEIANQWDQEAALLDELENGEEFLAYVSLNLSEHDLGLAIWLTKCLDDCEIEEE